jgi:hypothetical protein
MVFDMEILAKIILIVVIYTVLIEKKILVNKKPNNYKKKIVQHVQQLLACIVMPSWNPIDINF